MAGNILIPNMFITKSYKCSATGYKRGRALNEPDKR